MATVNDSLQWIFAAECPIPTDVDNLLIAGEQPIAAYKTLRENAIFTTKRLIVCDAQGLRGKKVEIYSLPYASINMWSSENASGFLDSTAELELWTRAGRIKIQLLKGIDVRKFDRLIAQCVFG